jgi:diketogulonate reductase-like aldo/keto reductase
MSEPANASNQRVRLLDDGNEIPVLGLGGPECIDAVRWALELGYRHIDTAQA